MRSYFFWAIKSCSTIFFSISTLRCDCFLLPPSKFFQYLSLFSNYFYTLFFAEIFGTDQLEIPFEDVNVDEFIELLRVIYPSRKAVDGNHSVSLILKLKRILPILPRELY